LWFGAIRKYAHFIRAQTGDARSPTWEISGTRKQPVFSPSVLG